jgi:hypothetical protein
MVVHCDREVFFGVFLTDYILVEILLYFFRLWHFFETKCRAADSFAVLLDDIVA